VGMKRGLALALVTVATSAVVTAQVHSGPGHPTPGIHASATNLPPRLSGGFGHNPGLRNGFGDRGFRRHRYPGYVYSYWPYYGYYGWDYPYDYYSADAYQEQPAAVAADPQPDDRYGDHSFDSPGQAKAQPAAAQEQDPTVLVFRDGHKQEIRNYAIVGQVLWDFGAQGTHKIPLSDLDLETTRKLNDERGVDFVLPKT